MEIHKAAAQSVIISIQSNFVRLYHGNIKPFEVVGSGINMMGGMGNMHNAELPRGVEPLAMSMALTVSHPLHRISREIRVAFGAEGNQTIMLVQCVPPRHKISDPNAEWEKVLWFNPEQVPSADVITQILVRYLNEIMKKLHELVTEGKAE